MKKLLTVVMMLVAATAFALDLGGAKVKVTAPKKVDSAKTEVSKAGDVTDVALKALTKKLKSVQNEKGPIVFKTGSAEIDVPKCETTLKAVHDIIATYPGFLVQIEGHTDNVGNPKSNLALSQKRADSVMKYLVNVSKTPANRLKAKGFGDTQPIADNKKPEGRAKNRRVDFSVTKM